MTICCCCFNDEIEEFISCGNSHTTCKDCLTTGIGVAITEVKSFKCPDGSNCDFIFSESSIASLVPTNLMESYEKTFIHDSLKNIADIHHCNICNYAAFIGDDYELEYFPCVTCNKLYCLECKKDYHPNEPCTNEIGVTAEFLNDNGVIICTCNQLITRGEACNHLTCKCGKQWCWWCKQPGFHDGRCPTYGEPSNRGSTGGINRIVDQLTTIERANLDRERLARVERVRLARIERERVEQERLARIERERLARLERERIERERVEQERLAQIERERLERERIETERLARLERERLERERVEKERIKREKLDKLDNTILELEDARPPIPVPALYNVRLSGDESKLHDEFFKACGNGSFKIVDTLLKSPGFMPVVGFFEAVYFNRVDIVKLLLSDGRILASSKTYNAVKQAVVDGRAEIVKLLLRDDRVMNSINIEKLMKLAIDRDRELIFTYLNKSRILSN